MVQVRPLIARELAEAAHDRVLCEGEEVVAQGRGAGEVRGGEEREGGAGPEGVAGVGGLAGPSAHAGLKGGRAVVWGKSSRGCGGYEGSVEGAGGPHCRFIRGLVEDCGWVGGLLVLLGLLLGLASRCCSLVVDFFFVIVGEVCRGWQWDAEVCCWRRVGVYEGCLEA